MTKSSKQEKRLSDQKNSSGSDFTPKDLAGGRILMDYLASLDRISKKQSNILHEQFSEVGKDGIRCFLFHFLPQEWYDLERERTLIIEKIQRFLQYGEKN